MRFTRLLVLLSLGLVPACAGYRDAVRGAGHRTGAIMTTDLHHASAWKDVLYKNSGYSRKQVEVTPGSDFTRLTIREVRPGEDPNALAENLRTLAFRKPTVFGDTRIIIDLRR